MDYLLQRQETIFVNAMEPSETVKTSMMSGIMKSPYVMGFKHNSRL